MTFQLSPGHLAQRLSVVLGLLLCIPLSACSSGPGKPSLENELSSLESFLEDGKTNRDEVIARLGIPHASFEDDRILGYYLSSRDELILVFDVEGQLARHRFLRFPTGQP